MADDISPLIQSQWDGVAVDPTILLLLIDVDDDSTSA